MGETDMASSAHSPNSVVERYTLSRSNCSIGFEIGSNVLIHMGSHDEDETTRERDSSNVHTKIIMTHNFDVQSLTGRVLTNRYTTVGFRYNNSHIGETVTMIDLETKKRYRLKEFGKDGATAVDIAFAQHHDLFAVLTEDATLKVFEAEDKFIFSDYLQISNFPHLTNLPNSEKPKICWCPFVPGEDDDDHDDYTTGCNLLAVYGGRYLYIVDMGVLKRQNIGTFSFEDASLFDCAILSLTIENVDDVDEDVRIVSVCISPDGSAVAVAKSVGPVAFYYIDRDIGGLKYAHSFDARAGFGGRVNTTFTDLIFLDNTQRFEREEIFWKCCLAVSNGGRQLALFECQNWKRIGLIRFESPRTVNDFVPIIDPKGDFVHFLDVDGSNVYSVEIFDGLDAPKFVGVTQTSFCHPIYAITHIIDTTFENEIDEDDIFQNDEDSGDDEKHDNDDQNDSTEGPSTSNSTTKTTNRKKKPKTKRHFVAMGKKSMQELQVTLTKYGTFDRKETEVSSPSKNSILNELTVGIHSPKQDYHFPQYSDSNENEVGGKLDEIASQLDRMEEDRKETNLRIMEMINNLDERMRQRDDYMLNRVEQICENSRLEVISALRDGLGSIEGSIERANTGASEYVSQRVGSSVRTGLQECVVPAFERTCDSLFDRLNDQFRVGLSDYLNATSATIQTAAVAAVQLAAQSAAPVASAPPQSAYDSRAQILQLLKTSPELAFESALNTGDPNLLEFVCSNVNPDTLFGKPNSMSQPVLVSLLQQLTLTLAHERDLKYRYIEHILPAINVSDADTMQHVPNVASQLLTTLQDIINNTNDEHIRRHTRLLFQLTRSTFYQSPHPTRSLVSDLHTGSQNSPM